MQDLQPQVGVKVSVYRYCTCIGKHANYCTGTKDANLSMKWTITILPIGPASTNQLTFLFPINKLLRFGEVSLLKICTKTNTKIINTCCKYLNLSKTFVECEKFITLKFYTQIRLRRKFPKSQSQVDLPTLLHSKLKAVVLYLVKTSLKIFTLIISTWEFRNFWEPDRWLVLIVHGVYPAGVVSSFLCLLNFLNEVSNTSEVQKNFSQIQWSTLCEHPANVEVVDRQRNHSESKIYKYSHPFSPTCSLFSQGIHISCHPLQEQKHGQNILIELCNISSATSFYKTRKNSKERSVYTWRFQVGWSGKHHYPEQNCSVTDSQHWERQSFFCFLYNWSI